MSTPKAETLTPEMIKKRNADFEKLSPAEKRVTIAKDVIAALNAKRIIAQDGHYIEVGIPGVQRFESEYYHRSKELETLDAQTALLNNQVQCNVCAIGSVFVCAVERMDKLKVGEMNCGKDDMFEYLGDLFEPDQLNLMEIAFERTTEHSYMYRPESDARDRALEFGSDFVTSDYDDENDCYDFDADGCMRGIMQNVIDNNGEFKP